MANVEAVLTDVGKDAKSVLTWLTNAEKKVTTASPKAVAGLALLLQGAATAMGNVSAAAAAGGLNIALDSATFTSLESVWPEVKALAADLGIGSL